MATITSGLAGGLAATIVMTVAMMAAGDDSPPPTAIFYSKFLGDEGPDAYQMQGMVLHLVYGTIAGGVLAALLPLVGATALTITTGVLWGLAWGLVLFVVGAGFWLMMVLGVEADAKMAGTFLVLHLVYGAVLGAWLGYGILA